MSCYMREEAQKIMEKDYEKKILIDIILDKMSCAELEQFVKENR